MHFVLPIMLFVELHIPDVALLVKFTGAKLLTRLKVNSPSKPFIPTFANSFSAFTAAPEAVLAILVLDACAITVLSADTVALCIPANPAGSSVEIALMGGRGVGKIAFSPLFEFCYYY